MTVTRDKIAQEVLLLSIFALNLANVITFLIALYKIKQMIKLLTEIHIAGKLIFKSSINTTWMITHLILLLLLFGIELFALLNYFIIEARGD